MPGLKNKFRCKRDIWHIYLFNILLSLPTALATLIIFLRQIGVWYLCTWIFLFLNILLCWYKIWLTSYHRLPWIMLYHDHHITCVNCCVETFYSKDENITVGVIRTHEVPLPYSILHKLLVHITRILRMEMSLHILLLTTGRGIVTETIGGHCVLALIPGVFQILGRNRIVLCNEYLDA